jgi:NADPH:quinone reductase-like Zn-dependent oxidoreductase
VQRPERRSGAVDRRSPCDRLRVRGLRRRAGAVRYDVILDNVGNRSIRDLRSAVTPTGTVIVNGGGSPGHVIGAVGSILRAAILNLFVRQQITFVPTTQSREDLLAVAELVENGALRPVIDRTYPLVDTAAALRYVEAGHARGKVVIAVT